MDNSAKKDVKYDIHNKKDINETEYEIQFNQYYRNQEKLESQQFAQEAVKAPIVCESYYQQKLREIMQGLSDSPVINTTPNLSELKSDFLIEKIEKNITILTNGTKGTKWFKTQEAKAKNGLSVQVEEFKAGLVSGDLQNMSKQNEKCLESITILKKLGKKYGYYPQDTCTIQRLDLVLDDLSGFVNAYYNVFASIQNLKETNLEQLKNTIFLTWIDYLQQKVDENSSSDHIVGNKVTIVDFVLYAFAYSTFLSNPNTNNNMLFQIINNYPKLLAYFKGLPKFSEDYRQFVNKLKDCQGESQIFDNNYQGIQMEESDALSLDDLISELQSFQERIIQIIQPVIEEIKQNNQSFDNMENSNYKKLITKFQNFLADSTLNQVQQATSYIKALKTAIQISVKVQVIQFVQEEKEKEVLTFDSQIKRNFEKRSEAALLMDHIVKKKQNAFLVSFLGRAQKLVLLYEDYMKSKSTSSSLSNAILSQNNEVLEGFKLKDSNDSVYSLSNLLIDFESNQQPLQSQHDI